MNAIKKDWGGIVAKVQVFVPQEYCDAGCYRPIIEHPNWGETSFQGTGTGLVTHENYYIDVNGSTTVDSGERFKIATGKSTGSISNQAENRRVGIYRHTESTKEGVMVIGDAYTTAKHYWLIFSATVKTVDNYAYYLPDGVNAS